KSALQQVIGVAEVYELFALLIDGEKGHVPAISGRRILDFAGSLVRDNLQRYAESCSKRATEDDGYPAVTVSILDGELRGWRWRDGNREPKLSGRYEFPQGRIGHRQRPKKQGSECRHWRNNSMWRLWLHSGGRHLRILQVHGVESSSDQAAGLGVLTNWLTYSSASGLPFGTATAVDELRNPPSRICASREFLQPNRKVTREKARCNRFGRPS